MQSRGQRVGGRELPVRLIDILLRQRGVGTRDGRHQPVLRQQWLAVVPIELGSQ